LYCVKSVTSFLGWAKGTACDRPCHHIGCFTQSPWISDRIPVGGETFRTTQTGPGAHPASYTMGTGSFPGVKRPGLGSNHPPHLAPRLKKG